MSSSMDSPVEVDPPSQNDDAFSRDSAVEAAEQALDCLKQFQSGFEEGSFLAQTGKRLQLAVKSVLETTTQAVESGRRRLRSGTSVESTTASTAKSSSSTTPAPGELELENLMNVAEYEIHQDPYRGIMAREQSLEIGTTITTPWNACEWGTLPPEPLEDPALLDPQVMVRHVGNCACPSLKEWTRTLLEERAKKSASNNKKRKRSLSSSDEKETTVQELFTVGVRPEGKDFACPCDFNPLCLATLGGVVNDVMEERCRALNEALPPERKGSPPTVAKFLKTAAGKVIKKSKENDDDDEVQVVGESISSSGATTANKKSSPVEIVDIEEVKPTPRKRSVFRDPARDSDSSDPFEFNGDNRETPIARKKKANSSSVPWSSPLLKASTNAVTDENPADIFTTSAIPQQELSAITFAEETRDALKAARHSVEVDTASLRSYIHRMLRVEPLSVDEDDGERLTVDKYMQILKDWHQHLQFVNPVADEKVLADDRTSLSMPPGISNLGATCYLNTQLQCLAQNLTFLNGIFSWRMVDESHQMNSVMSKLQKLLAEMFLGGHCKLTTLDFSNSLGLEHHEQQDPNEFARLLFDRMDESFQQCEGDLRNLLNKIFHGLTTYETVCMTCGSTSERSEGFMDLNLPIVKPPKDDNAKKTGTIEEAFAVSAGKNVDTDVQYCLDQYLCTEILDGENRYFCSQCDCKRDAKRSLKLAELPPVLNVQLSRYVFDREKFVKKKVSDKVLLPRTLAVQTGATTKKYFLCAIMRHQGNSAYSGHYVAEALDWLTGMWFEFNDENVKLLPDGPTCSYDPEAVPEPMDANNRKEKSSTPSGSQDAYNMYYVDQDYLAMTAKDAIVVREQLLQNCPNPGEVLGDVTDERKKMFRILSELCFHDAQISDRLNRRKLGIRKYMIPTAHALVRGKNEANDDGGVWVSTEFLRPYFQCRLDLDLDGALESSTVPVLRHSSFLCNHRYMCPKMARKGKLLPRPMYEALISLLQGEKAIVNHDYKPTEENRNDIDECKITPGNNLFCQECSASYREELAERLELLRAAKELYDAFDTKKGEDVPAEYKEGEEPICEEDKYVYVLSRQTATKFRKLVASVMRTASKVECGGIYALPYEGLGDIDLSPIARYYVTKDGTTKFANPHKSPDDCPDEYFNSNITCSHGNCNSMNKKSQVRYVGPRVWKLVKKFFPRATEHRMKRELKNGKNEAGVESQGCLRCRTEKASVEDLREALQAWALNTREKADLKTLLDGKRNLSRDKEILNHANGANGCRLLHKADLKRWRVAVRTLSNAQKLKGDNCDELRAHVENLVFPSLHKVVLDFENEPVDKLVGSIRSFTCSEHHMVIKHALLGTSSNTDGSTTSIPLADYIVGVGRDEYLAYIQSLATLLRILRADGGLNPSFMGSPIVIDEEKAFIKHIRNAVGAHHPTIRTRLSEEEDGENNIMKIALDGSVKTCSVQPGICAHESCTVECAPLLVLDEKDDDRIESISLDSSGDTKPAAKQSNPSRGSGAFDAIMVESDDEDQKKRSLFPIRIFWLKNSATEEEMLESLQDAAAIQHDIEPSDLRRSSRKRKAAYPCGVLINEYSVQIGLNYNLAAILLRLCEETNILCSFRKVFLVLTPAFEKATVMKADPSKADKMEPSLESLISRLRDARPDDEHFDSKKHAIILFCQGPGDSEDASYHETLVMELVQLTNTWDEAPETNNVRVSGSAAATAPKRSRQSERGFRGTLLQSGAPRPSPASNNSNGDDDCEIQGQPEASTISDEDNQKEPHPRPRMVADDSPSSRPSYSSNNNSSSNNNVHQMVLSDDDDNDSSDDDKVLNSSPTFKAKRDKESPKDADDSSFTRVEKVFERLESALRPQKADPNKAWEAAYWACGENPDEQDVTSLLDAAFAKYLDDGDGSMG